MKLEGEAVYRGNAKGRALVSRNPISFLGGIDPGTGKIIEYGHELKGKSVKNKILVFPNGKGSTVGSYVIYQLAKNGTAPAAIINREAETIVAAGAIIAEIPLVHRLEKDPIKLIDNGDLVTVKDGKISVKNDESTTRS